jgi:two-component system sensor histidine kinase DesK
VRLLWRLSVLVYLPFFAFPVYYLVVGDHPPVARAVGAAGLAVLVALYVPTAYAGVFRPDDAPDPVGRIVACTAIAGALVLLLGVGWAQVMTFVAYLAGGTIRRGPGVAAGAVVAVVLVGAAAVLAVAQDPAMVAWLLFSLLAGLYGVGFGWLAATYRELDRARVELARLAVAEERLRFSRDLHDLLGHSLSVIALKSELAGQLVRRDPDRAAQEVDDIERVSRQALAEVRAAVTGYRGSVALGAELDRARSALAAAGVTTRIDAPPAPLPPAAEELLAWTVREGTTNIVRHAGARTAVIRVHHTDDGVGVELVDDGRGAGADPVPGPANGLDGLAERVAAADGEFEAGAAPGGGFRLAVRVPQR